MNRHEVHLLDLPVEILLNIFKRLDNIDVLYSLIGVDGLDLLAQDDIFTNTLDLKSTDDRDIELVLNRFLNDILPRIHHKVKCLNLETTTMDRVLRAGIYPNLNQLEIIKFQPNSFSDFCTDELLFRSNFKKHITNLKILYSYYFDQQAIEQTTTILSKLFNFYENLNDFNCIEPPGSSDLIISLIGLPFTTLSSSTVTKLSVTVNCFEDCLCLLDGRLNHLSTLIVIISKVKYCPTMNFNSNVLLNLKSFALTYQDLTDHYDNQIVPLLCQMCNLQDLTLYICIEERNRIIDRIQLENDILMHLSKLQTFVFFISVGTDGHLSYDDIQRTFFDFKFGKVGGSISYLEGSRPSYNIFSIPYEFHTITFIGNIFTDTIFKNVIGFHINDTVPFEHEFFVRLARSFPILNFLYIRNAKGQLQNSSKSKDNDNESFKFIEYPHLTALYFIRTHIDYVDQMFNASKTRLPCLEDVIVDYVQLKTVTNNFTREETRLNCVNVKSIKFYRFGLSRLKDDEFIRAQSKGFYDYFPSLEL